MGDILKTTMKTVPNNHLYHIVKEAKAKENEAVVAALREAYQSAYPPQPLSSYLPTDKECAAIFETKLEREKLRCKKRGVPFHNTLHPVSKSFTKQYHLLTLQIELL